MTDSVEEIPVPALDEVGEGPALEDADGNEIELDAESNDHPMIGEPARVNEWGFEIGDHN